MPLERSSFLTLALAGSVVLLCLSLSTSSQIVGQGTDSGLGGANSIGGYVIGPGGKRMQRRIQIRLGTATRGNRMAMTDDSGNFLFTRLPPGSYTLTIDKEPDFEPITYAVEIIQPRGSPPQNYHVSLKLAPRAGETIKPGVLNAAFADVPKVALEHFSTGQELAKAGDHKGAIAALQQAIAVYPNFMLAYNEMGVEYLRVNDLAKADASFKEALKISPEAFQPLMNRGMLLVQTKRFAEAVPLIRAALKAKEQSPVAHYFLGQALANLGDFDEAQKELLTAVKSGDPVVKEAYRTLAIIYSSKGNKKAAAEQLETYLKLTPQAPDAEQLRQVIAQLKGEPAPASDKKPNK
jgi:Tfp pilus assembly protein PilF